jgi:hypothetical protein
LFAGLSFSDVVIRNMDTRLLRDLEGNTALLYSFPNESTLIITTNEGTFFEVSQRTIRVGASN